MWDPTSRSGVVSRASDVRVIPYLVPEYSYLLTHISQALVGVALYYLWQLVPLVGTDPYNKAVRRSESGKSPVPSGMPPRVMSERAVSRLEYY